MTGAFGVGICPCAAKHHLVGLSGLGEVRYFVSTVHNPRSFNDPVSGWVCKDAVPLYASESGVCE
jgi:hypothetical protein